MDRTEQIMSVYVYSITPPALSIFLNRSVGMLAYTKSSQNTRPFILGNMMPGCVTAYSHAGCYTNADKQETVKSLSENNIWA